MGPILDRLFRDALSLARAARSRCGHLRPDASMGALAAEVALKLLGEAPRQALVIGAGRIAESAAKSLAAQGTGAVLVANRTYDSACKLAHQMGGSAIHFEALESALIEADVVIAATAAPHLILRAATVEAARRARADRP